MNPAKYTKYLIKWMKENVNKAQLDGVVFGLSGGIDSAIVACLAKRAFPNNSLAVIMPINKMAKSDYEDAKLLTKKISIDFEEINLSKTFNKILKTIKIKSELSISNIKPRLRMTTLYAKAQDKNYMVLGTSNYDEMKIGYFTKFGDGAADLLPLGNLTKVEIFELAKYLDIPESIINKKPSAGLYEGQNDEMDLGFSYQELNDFFKNKKIAVVKKKKIKQRIEKNKHKLIATPIPKKP